jgi:hypothetical protein
MKLCTQLVTFKSEHRGGHSTVLDPKNLDHCSRLNKLQHFCENVLRKVHFNMLNDELIP